MNNAGCGQWELPGEQFPQALCTRPLAGAAVKPVVPQAPGLMAEARERGKIATDAVVGIMPTHFLTQLAVLLRHRLMAVFFAPLRNVREGGAELLSLGLALNRIASAPRLLPVMGEAEEVEGLRLVVAFPRVAEVHDPGFLRMDRQPVALESLGHLRQKRLGILAFFADHHEVVSKTDKLRLTLQLWFDLSLEPTIQHLVQVYITEHWGYDSPLRSSCLRVGHPTPFPYPGFQPLANQPTNHSI